MAYTPDQFADILGEAIPKTGEKARTVVEKGAHNVKDEGRRNSRISSGRSARKAPGAISYDLKEDGPLFSAEIGYEGSNQGNLGVLLEFGGGRDHSPPHLDLGRALAVEEPRFVQAIEDLGEQVLD